MPACLPGGQHAGDTKQLPSNAKSVTITAAANGHYAVKADQPGILLMDLRSLALPAMRHGKLDVTAMTAGRYVSVPNATEDPLAFVFAFGANAGAVCRSAAAGADFSGKVEVSCGAE